MQLLTISNALGATAVVQVLLYSWNTLITCAKVTCAFIMGEPQSPWAGGGQISIDSVIHWTNAGREEAGMCWEWHYDIRSALQRQMRLYLEQSDRTWRSSWPGHFLLPLWVTALLLPNNRKWIPYDSNPRRQLAIPCIHLQVAPHYYASLSALQLHI